MASTLIKRVANPDKISLGKDSLAFWAPHSGGFLSTPAKFGIQLALENVLSGGEWTGEATNERKFFNAGFKYRKANDGYTYSGSMVVEGMAIQTIAWLAGKDLATSAGMLMKEDYGVKGDLIVGRCGADGKTWVQWDIYTNVGWKNLSGLGLNDAENNATLECYIEDGLAFSIDATLGEPCIEFWGPEGHADDPTTGGPDASDVTFVLGTGLRSYAAAASVVALDTGRTGLDQYFISVRQGEQYTDGDQVADDEVTYDSGTRTLTFGTAPGATDYIRTFFIVDPNEAGDLGKMAHHAGTPEPNAFNTIEQALLM